MSVRLNLIGNSLGPWKGLIGSLNTLKPYFGHFFQRRSGSAMPIQAHYSPMHQK